MHLFRRAGVALIAVVLGLLAITPGASASGRSFSAEQKAAFAQFGLTGSQVNAIVVDSAMSRAEALGDDSIVPPEARKAHHQIAPYLVVIPVVYHGYDNRPHIGQMVAHRYMVGKVIAIFLKMWQTGFPVQSVIPESKFHYDDEASMEANNSSGYRPELDSEHIKGSALDFNTFANPFDVTAYDPSRPIQPTGAHYDPNAKGTIVLGDPVQREFARLNLEWGGNWGNPQAVPPTDFFRVGFFDYQHVQLNYKEYDYFEQTQLPPDFAWQSPDTAKAATDSGVIKLSVLKHLSKIAA